MERVAAQASDAARLQGENKLLKRAVAIQNQQKEEVQNENNALKQLATQAAEHMKRLEQANYTLRVHLQTSTNAGLGHHLMCTRPSMATHDQALTFTGQGIL
ncbi:uncharacterized protein PITG_00742 [Phytophthora infestans T30-4]|uniref:Uncharacterized protein n=1 Tax=Phytophthora infestans (strain T30-4) TaxID=403677 RepID=D0MRK8_PHYIT|nr:uncharacterized protein PITG_00742 [Phytophthora infestans T30-4]EEY58127.1 conserved hypothetical protein [Phytophthora infestans T30-4]|eukprot:XP_002909313.1 conserved hypothetical protein [Phytophthora infestans T30-4]